MQGKNQYNSSVSNLQNGLENIKLSHVEVFLVAGIIAQRCGSDWTLQE